MPSTNTMSRSERRAALRVANGQSPATAPVEAPAVEAPAAAPAVDIIDPEPTPMQRLVALSAKVASGTATVPEINEMIRLTTELQKTASKAAEDESGKLASKVRAVLASLVEEIVTAGMAINIKPIKAQPAVAEIKDAEGKVTQAAIEAKPANISIVLSAVTPGLKLGTNGAARGPNHKIGALTSKEIAAWWCRHKLGLSNKAGGQKLGTNASTFSVQAIAAEKKIEDGAGEPTVSPF